MTSSEFVRIHVADSTRMAEPWRLTAARFKAAAERNIELAGRYKVSFGTDEHPNDEALAEAEILLAGRFSAQDLSTRAPRLKWFQSTSAGVERIIQLVPPGVILTNSSGADPAKAGEFCITALLMLNHGFAHFATCQRNRVWDPSWRTPLHDKRLVILGTGAIGTAAARLAKLFGLEVIGISRSARPRRGFAVVIGPEQLKSVLPAADFLLVAAPLTAETRGMIGAAALDLLPRHAGLVNVGRSGIIDYDALAERLADGRLAGAVLDVFPEEPLPTNSPLWTTPNLVVSPHCGIDDASDFIDGVLEIFFENLARFLANKRLRNLVDLAAGY